ncbi:MULTISPECIES: ABC transporter permease [unclassified Pantoea]|uniref:ABC transporter permease n=1 Tax=unclassified Pantoea TaxID=2630326 RepID=UPI001CD33596|nr:MULTISPECIES: ABC transporter permease [unclassified Pantoea]MCA1177792.1 ABC transporter permease [Pantoea sp. alder69]MCA1252919.1 ABC transporter permease [Pantoea sp. alder70]MCA1266444.1 ABC transporter permease [Pantoea sp. alder81]
MKALTLSFTPLAAWRRWFRSLEVVLGSLLLAIVLLMALLADWLYPDDPLEMVAQPFLWPGDDAHFPLGTDSLGRDVAAGIFHGARVSLQIGTIAVVVSVVIGLIAGSSAGYFGGKTDRVVTRISELFQTFPAFLLVVVLVAIGHPTVNYIAGAIGVASWPMIARLVRAECRLLRHQEFVLAAQTLGYSPLRILLREVLPNLLPTLIVTLSVMMASAILTESSLGFLGFSDPNRISWGGMIGDGRQSLQNAWYLAVLPGSALAATILALNLLGDALNDWLNPRRKGAYQ